MWRIVVTAVLVAVAACTGGRAVKVRCDRHLVRINALAPAHPSARSTPVDGDNR